MIPFRDRTAAMYRIKDEACWIRKSLERTWQVASRVVIFDDGSTDDTLNEATAALGDGMFYDEPVSSIGGVDVYRSGPDDGLPRELHWINSPFANDDVRPTERANEIRDRGILWWYMKSNVPFEHVLCLDGDEWLSLEAIRTWPKVAAAMGQGVDFVQLPFVYLWDGDNQQRIDGIYGPEVDGDGRCLICAADGYARGEIFPASVHCASPRKNGAHVGSGSHVNRTAPTR